MLLQKFHQIPIKFQQLLEKILLISYQIPCIIFYFFINKNYILICQYNINNGDFMLNFGLSDYITLTRTRTNDSIKLDQRNVKIREMKMG